MPVIGCYRPLVLGRQYKFLFVWLPSTRRLHENVPFVVLREAREEEWQRELPEGPVVPWESGAYFYDVSMD